LISIKKMEIRIRSGIKTMPIHTTTLDVFTGRYVPANAKVLKHIILRNPFPIDYCSGTPKLWRRYRNELVGQLQLA
jgi:hypothetical protein